MKKSGMMVSEVDNSAAADAGVVAFGARMFEWHSNAQTPSACVALTDGSVRRKID